jgi:hypothetical protein
MRRYLFLILILLVVAVGAVLLFRLGHYYVEYAFAAPRLEVDGSTPVSAQIGEEVELDLYGAGFSADTRVSLVPSASDSSAVIGSFPLAGTFNASLLVGDTLFLGSNNDGVKVIDISRPREPKLIGAYLAGRPILDIQREGKLFYFACGQLGIVIMELADDRRLIPYGEIAVTGVALASCPQNGYLFVAAGKQGLLVYDVARSANNRLVNRYDNRSFVLDIASYRNHLYLTTRSATIEILRFDSYFQLQLMRQLPLQEIPRDIAVVGESLYLTTPSSLLLFSLANPAFPRRHREWNEIGSAGKIFTGKQQVYVCDSFSHLHSVDRESLKIKETFVGVGDIRVLAEKGQFFFLAGSDRGLLIVDRTRLRGAHVSGTIIGTSGSAHDLLLVDDRLYVADAHKGLQLIDLSADGWLKQKQITDRWAESLAVSRDRMYVAQGRDGLALFDVSSPGQPTELANWPDISAWRLANLGPYLVIGQGFAGLSLLDTRNISRPQVTDRLSDVHPLGIATDTGRVFVASKAQGLLIYRISAQGKLVLEHKVVLPFPMGRFAHAVAVAVKDAVAYVANGRSGLLVVAVAEGRRPEILASLALPGFSKQVRVRGDRAIVSGGQGGLSVIDIADPEHPRTLGKISITGLSRGLLVENERLYVGRNEMGVALVPMPLAAEKVERVSNHHVRVQLPAIRHRGLYDLHINNRLGYVVQPRALICQ